MWQLCLQAEKRSADVVAKVADVVIVATVAIVETAVVVVAEIGWAAVELHFVHYRIAA